MLLLHMYQPFAESMNSSAVPIAQGQVPGAKMRGRCTQQSSFNVNDVLNHKAVMMLLQVSMSSDAVREAISASTPGSAAVLLPLLVDDVKLRDRSHLASLAIRSLHSLLVHCGVKTVRTPFILAVFRLMSDSWKLMDTSVIHRSLFHLQNRKEYRHWQQTVLIDSCLQAELSGQNIASICAASDGKVLKRVIEPYMELLVHIWCDSGLLEADARERARTSMARTLGRQQTLSSDTLAFVRQHVVRYQLQVTGLQVLLSQVAHSMCGTCSCF